MVKGESRSKASLAKDVQIFISKSYPGLRLESSIQGWYFLKNFEQGIKEYQKLKQPTVFDTQWVGICYFMLGQVQEAITYSQIAISEGNGPAHIFLANIYLFSGRPAMVIPELEKVDFDSLSPYYKHLFLIIRAQFYEAQCNLIKALPDAEMAWSIGHTLPEWPLLMSRNAFALSSIHSDMGKLRSALWYLEEAIRSNPENDAIKVTLMKADILSINGYFTELEFRVQKP